MGGLGKFFVGGLLGALFGFLVSPKRAQKVRDALFSAEEQQLSGAPALIEAPAEETEQPPSHELYDWQEVVAEVPAPGAEEAGPEAVDTEEAGPDTLAADSEPLGGAFVAAVPVEPEAGPFEPEVTAAELEVTEFEADVPEYEPEPLPTLEDMAEPPAEAVAEEPVGADEETASEMQEEAEAEADAPPDTALETDVTYAEPAEIHEPEAYHEPEPLAGPEVAEPEPKATPEPPYLRDSFWLPGAEPEHEGSGQEQEDSPFEADIPIWTIPAGDTEDVAQAAEPEPEPEPRPEATWPEAEHAAEASGEEAELIAEPGAAGDNTAEVEVAEAEEAVEEESWTLEGEAEETTPPVAEEALGEDTLVQEPSTPEPFIAPEPYVAIVEQDEEELPILPQEAYAEGGAESSMPEAESSMPEEGSAIPVEAEVSEDEAEVPPPSEESIATEAEGGAQTESPALGESAEQAPAKDEEPSAEEPALEAPDVVEPPVASPLEPPVVPPSRRAVAPADLKARIEETRRRIQRELEQPFAAEEEQLHSQEQAFQPPTADQFVPDHAATDTGNLEEEAEASSPEAETAEEPEITYAEPAEIHEPEAYHEPEPLAGPEVAEPEPIYEAEAVKPEVSMPAAAAPEPATPEAAVSAAPPEDTERTAERSAPVDAATGEFDHEAMRRRIEATRNRLKAKAFDAMMSGEAALLGRDPGGSRGRTATEDVDVDSEVEETIESTLSEEDF